MPKFHITTSKGTKYEIEAPDDAAANTVAQQLDADNPAQYARGKPTPFMGTVRPTSGPKNLPMMDGQVPAALAAVRGFAQGGSFNFADEIAAAGNAILPIDKLKGDNVTSVWDGKSFGDAYNANMQQQNAQGAVAQTEHPIATGFGNLAGTLAGAVGGLKAAAGALPSVAEKAAAFTAKNPKLAALIFGAAGGGGGGTVSGYGAGDTEENRIKGAKVGGTIGTLAGGGLGVTVAGLAPVVGRYWNVLRGKNAEGEALRQIIVALGRDEYDVTSPAGVLALKQELAKFTGKPVSLADIGNATRARAGVALRTPSDVSYQAQDTLFDRTHGQADRLVQTVKQTIAPRTDIHAIDADLVAQRSAAAEPLRLEALRDPADLYLPSPATPDAIPEALPVSRIVNDDVLNRLTHLPMAQRALTEARQLAEAERGRLAAEGKDISHLPDLSDPNNFTPDARSLDYLKRYLDQAVNGAYSNSGTFTRAEANELKLLRNAIRDRMRTVIPGYGDYLDNYSAGSDMIDALRAGRGHVAGEAPTDNGFHQLDPERITQQQGERSDAAQEFYRVGVARKMEDLINKRKDTNNAASVLSSDLFARIKAAGASDPAALRTSFDQEKQLNRLYAEMQGSQTDTRKLASRDADAGAQASLPFNPGSAIGWAGAIGRGILNHTSTVHNANVTNELLPRLMAQDPQVIEATIARLVQQGDAQAADAVTRAYHAKLYPFTVGGAVGAPVTNREDR